jgi:hypothetical protein
MVKRAPDAIYEQRFYKEDAGEAVFLADTIQDNTVSALVALGAELWSVRRRLFIVESLLEDHGVTAEQIEQYRPSPKQTASWNEERDGFIDRVYGLLGKDGKLRFSEQHSESRSRPIDPAT